MLQLGMFQGCLVLLRVISGSSAARPTTCQVPQKADGIAAM